ncbi:unnamed protein product, partial [Dibothriocephalus latus]
MQRREDEMAKCSAAAATCDGGSKPESKPPVTQDQERTISEPGDREPSHEAVGDVQAGKANPSTGTIDDKELQTYDLVSLNSNSTYMEEEVRVTMIRSHDRESQLQPDNSDDEDADADPVAVPSKSQDTDHGKDSLEILQPSRLFGEEPGSKYTSENEEEQDAAMEQVSTMSTSSLDDTKDVLQEIEMHQHGKEKPPHSKDTSVPQMNAPKNEFDWESTAIAKDLAKNMTNDKRGERTLGESFQMHTTSTSRKTEVTGGALDKLKTLPLGIQAESTAQYTCDTTLWEQTTTPIQLGHISEMTSFTSEEEEEEKEDNDIRHPEDYSKSPTLSISRNTRRHEEATLVVRSEAPSARTEQVSELTPLCSSPSEEKDRVEQVGGQSTGSQQLPWTGI